MCAGIRETTFNLDQEQFFRNFLPDGEMEKTDLHDPIVALVGAYAELANGIHEDISAGKDDIAGEHISGYRYARDVVYEELFEQAVATNEYGLLLAIIIDFKESTLAKRLLREVRAKKETGLRRKSDDMDSFLISLHKTNDRIDRIQNSVKVYSINEWRRNRSNAMRSRLYGDGKTAVLDALVLGMYLKLRPKIIPAGLYKKYFFDPLYEVAGLPDVPDQLIKNEKEAPLTGLMVKNK